MERPRGPEWAMSAHAVLPVDEDEDWPPGEPAWGSSLRSQGEALSARLDAGPGQSFQLEAELASGELKDLALCGSAGSDDQSRRGAWARCWPSAPGLRERRRRKDLFTASGRTVTSVENEESQRWLPVFVPGSAGMRRWNKTFLSLSMLNFFVDPLFFFILGILYVEGEFACMTVYWARGIVLTVLRSCLDLCFVAQILVKFRTAYVVPQPQWWRSLWPQVLEDRSGLAPGELVKDPKHIAIHYVREGGFFLDLLSALPIPQVLVLVAVPRLVNDSTASFALLCITIVVQVLSRSAWFLLRVSEATANYGDLMDSVSSFFLFNLYMYIVSAYIIGCIWYLMAVYRVNSCLESACRSLGPGVCDPSLLYCPAGTATTFQSASLASQWASSNATSPTGTASAAQCLNPPSVSAAYFGIFTRGVAVVQYGQFIPVLLSAYFWGLQTVNGMGGGAMPSMWVPELLFVTAVALVGLLRLSVIVSNTGTILQGLFRRRFTYKILQNEVGLWMNRRKIPAELQKDVKKSLTLRWNKTRGVDDSSILNSLSDDLQRRILRNFTLSLLQECPLFAAMEPNVLDAFCACLKQRIYIDGTELARRGDPVHRMFFVLRGEVRRSLHGRCNKSGMLDQRDMMLGNVVGEELLVHHLEATMAASAAQGHKRKSLQVWYRGRVASHQGIPKSDLTALCDGDVEGYALEAADIAAVCKEFSKELATDRVLYALLRASHLRQAFYARTIQLAWRYYVKKRTRRRRVAAMKAHAKSS